MQVKGSAPVQIDADLQNLPGVILDFSDEWEQGIQVFVGIRQSPTESVVLRSFRFFGYYFISRVPNFKITQNAVDFRLIDREVIEILRKSRTLTHI